MKIDTIEHNGETIYLRKDWTGWRTVEPVRDPVTKKFIWKNFLSKKGFITLAFILLILVTGYLAFHEQLGNYHRVMENPCAYCTSCQAYARDFLDSNIKINKDVPLFNLTK